MAGRVLDLDKVIVPDQLACRIADYWHNWDMSRSEKRTAWNELRRYVYATDTTQTTNSALPWNNKTTIPKLCQIRDNLAANYMATMFPKRKWLEWIPSDYDSGTMEKRDAIINYSKWMIDQPAFKTEVHKAVLDYIDYGNTFVTVDWVDDTVVTPNETTQVGYVGPTPVRINPLDLVMNPVAPDFTHTPKIVRSLVTLGDVKEMITRQITPDNEAELIELFDYFRELRSQAWAFQGNWKEKDDYFRMDGFSSFKEYLCGDSCELLTFYGDIYDYEKDQFLRNHIITVVDRHKLLSVKPNPSYFGTTPMYHSGWRVRQDNLWAMGPLDNLIGMQYRIDHIENMKADIYDLTAFPPLKIKGYVEDFQWQPFEKVYVGDEGDVEPIFSDIGNILNANVEIRTLEDKMEEMAGAPKEAMGIRSPGEKTAYEVQRLENAASRIFANKISQFEEQILEPLINAMLELARRKMGNTSIRVFDDELKYTTFMELTPDDITGNGRVRPMAARHFAEKAELAQNLNNFFQSALGQDPEMKTHFSTIKMAQMFECILGIEDYEVVTPFVRLSEQADAQKIAQAQQEDTQMEAQTPSGINSADFDPDMLQEGESSPDLAQEGSE